MSRLSQPSVNLCKQIENACSRNSADPEYYASNVGVAGSNPAGSARCIMITMMSWWKSPAMITSPRIVASIFEAHKWRHGIHVQLGL